MRTTNIIIIFLLFNFDLIAEPLHQIQIEDKIGFIDSSGKIIIKPSYGGNFLSIFNKSNTAFVYNESNKCGYIDKNNNLIIDFKYYKCSPFNDGYAIVTSKWECINYSAKYSQSVIDTSGNIIFTVSDRKLISYSEGYFVYDLNKEESCGYELSSSSSIGRYGFLKKNGKEVQNIIFDYAISFNDGLSIVNSGGKWGIIDTKFQNIVPFKYNNISPFISDLSVVRLNNEAAVINKNAEIVIPFGRFFSINGFYDGLSKACLYELPKIRNKIKCKSVIIDTNGKVLFEESNEIHYIENFYEGFAGATNKNGLKGFIDKEWKWVIKPQYYIVFHFYDGVAEVYKTQSDWLNHRSTFIDKKGNVIWKHPDL